MKYLKTLSFVLLCLPVYVCAQSHLRYVYDNAGNRINREIVLSSTRLLPATEEMQEPYRDEMQTCKLKIYPNPTKGRLEILVSGLETIAGQANVYSISGTLILQTAITSNSTLLDLSAYTKGVYILQLKIGAEVSSWKIIKE
ncbi:MAG: T9SS type A sorting domain-containing protein [Prevotellaceae bacterium]|jgi:hypothetical protein|nr:T9SS type A sorting domain-containing protein [Prevotellaceae bacterium]